MMDLNKAIKIAVKAHTGQTDKGGRPYILHPLHVMMEVSKETHDNSALVVAVLHDVVEDSDWTLEGLEKQGLNMVEKNILRLLTKSNDGVYKEYIKKLHININEINSIDQIPYLPIQFFKSKNVFHKTISIQKI